MRICFLCPSPGGGLIAMVDFLLVVYFFSEIINNLYGYPFIDSFNFLRGFNCVLCIKLFCFTKINQADLLL